MKPFVMRSGCRRVAVWLISLWVTACLVATANSEKVAADSVDVKALAAGVDFRYDHLRSLEAQFTEIYRGAGLERTDNGTLWLKKPGKMRWEYRSPREKLFVSDGKEAWFYVPGDRQARATPAQQLQDLRSPLAFLLGKTKLEKELRGLSWAPDVTPETAGDVVLRGVPTAMEDQISEIVLEITPDHQIRRIIIRDADGASTEFRFSDQKEDVEVANERFKFKPPAGTEVVQGLGP
ncbi:MAG TPA: outer membrane lipoprotein chaperone LolA [Verrucomicrobiae bacterium]|nr:outer membrane lipoprotein chaperone LolA [Verrucomicrobiae bacterium]